MIIVSTQPFGKSGAPGTVRHARGTGFKFDSDGDLQILKDKTVIAAHFRGTWTQVVIEDEDEA